MSDPMKTATGSYEIIAGGPERAMRLSRADILAPQRAFEKGFLIKYLEAKRDYSQGQLDATTDLGVHCLPVDSQLNAYYQGLRDLSIELLARIRDNKFNTENE